ncbi:MAG TPA: DMT family transporter [Alphaproteobacteria bacterium]|nr:DMT family transporter [Alphaproteobacteria bacterium]
MPRLSANMLGVLLALACYAVYSWADAMVKGLGQALNIFEIGFFVTLFSFLPGLFAKPAGERWRQTFRLRRPWLTNLMALCRVGSATLVTYSFVTIPLAEAYCLVFLIPVFITILGVLVLREQVTPERWALVIVSFVGVLLVVRPGFRELELGHLTAVGCALCAAIATTILRFISDGEQRTSLFVLPTLYTLAFNLAMLPFFGWSIPDIGTAGLLLAAGLLGGLGYLLQIAAITVAPASRVAPMQYSQIVWALILGALFFAEIPDGIALAGLVVVVLAGIATIFADGARARIAGRWAQYRARRQTTPDDASRIAGPPEP